MLKTLKINIEEAHFNLLKFLYDNTQDKHKLSENHLKRNGFSVFHIKELEVMGYIERNHSTSYKYYYTLTRGGQEIVKQQNI